MTAPRTLLTDEQYAMELREGREHELALRQSDNDRLEKVARTKAEASRRRWPFVIGAIVATFLGLAITGLIYWGVQNTRADDAARDRQQMLNAEVAKACIQAGNIYYDGNCLLTQRTP